MICRITWWKTKQLHYGGRAMLINNVLQALPIHLLSAITPPTTVLKQIQMLMVDFFWVWKSDKKKGHWAS